MISLNKLTCFFGMRDVSQTLINSHFVKSFKRLSHDCLFSVSIEQSQKWCTYFDLPIQGHYKLLINRARRLARSFAILHNK